MRCSTRCSSTTSSCPTRWWSATLSDGWRLARTTLANERVNIATGMGRRPVRPVDYLPALGDQASPEALAQMMTECGAITADLLAFTAMSQRLLLRQIAGLQQGPEASVLKVAAAWNATRLQQAVLGWQGPGAATMPERTGRRPSATFPSRPR